METNHTFEHSPEAAADFSERVRTNQRKLTAELKPHYDFIVCGSGSSGSVVARRLAENPNVSVLLVEAGGSDDVPSVMEANQWHLNLGSERNWGFSGSRNSHLNGRAMPLPMGKVLGGGSSINLMVWSHGHKKDWDFFADEVADTAWDYESVLNIYRRIEDWQGAPDPRRRGAGGLVFVQSAPDPNPIAPAMVEAARAIGMPTFDSNNGRLMEAGGGVSILDLRVRDGKRERHHADGAPARGQVGEGAHRYSLYVLKSASGSPVGLKYLTEAMVGPRSAGSTQTASTRRPMRISSVGIS